MRYESPTRPSAYACSWSAILTVSAALYLCSRHGHGNRVYYPYPSPPAHPPEQYV
jgi:hypothetical protein